MVEIIFASPIIPTPIEARVFIAICCVYLVYDYVSEAKRAIEIKRKRRAQRQIFDEHNEVSLMIHKAVSTIQFSTLEFSRQIAIISYINNNYR